MLTQYAHLQTREDIDDLPSYADVCKDIDDLPLEDAIIYVC